MTSIVQTAMTLQNHIRKALYGHPGRPASGHADLNDARHLSKEFALASPMGGAAIVAIQTLGRHTRH